MGTADPLIGLVRYRTPTSDGVTHRKAEEYRRLAQQCLAMAQVWQRLADEQDRSPDLAERPPPPPGGEQIQPIVQQQQQVQPKDDDTKEKE